MDYIFIHGAPGFGKSSLAWALQAELQSPCFDFGWIPEFRVKQNSTITYAEEEALSFENLTLALKNYVRHGFGNILVTDLRDPFILQLPEHFGAYRYVLVTLYLNDEAELKKRVLDVTRSSGYREWQDSIRLNREIIERPSLEQEVRLESSQARTELVSAVVELIHQQR